MEDVSECPLVPPRVLVELAVVGAHLYVLGPQVAPAIALYCTHVFLKGSTAAQIGDLRLCHTLAFLGDENFKRSKVSLFFDLFLLAFFLGLDVAFDCLNITLQPPLLLELAQFLLANDLFFLLLNHLSLRVESARHWHLVELISVLCLQGLIVGV